MDQLRLTPPTSPTPARRGRPPGSGNRRSVDLAKYIEATFGGMTPGQQAAQLCLVTPKELAAVAKAAKALGISPMQAAMAQKAAALAVLIGCTTKEAYGVMAHEREALLPYVHQKRAPAPEVDPAKDRSSVFILEAGGGSEQLPDDRDQVDPDAIEILEVLPTPADQVGRGKSDAAA